MFEKVLVANRGEIAVRIIRTCKVMGVRTVAIYSDADRGSAHVSLADEAAWVGPPDAESSYLNIRRIVERAKESGADAVHPGYGFLSENLDFASACDSAGLAFIGPKAATLARTGDKIECLKTVRKAGIPVIPASDRMVNDAASAHRYAEEIGYPVLLKSAFGGGGRGIREAGDRRELEENFRSAAEEVKRSFGKPGLYVEKLVRPARHIEFQILSDKGGRTIHLGERECSVQRRHQKLMEFTPSPALDEAARKRVGDLAVRVAESVGYENAGTVEFLRDKDGEFYFIEVNARLQVEHPVTEAVTGVDLVQQQLLIASGEGMPLSQKGVIGRGASIQCRINAEDPAVGFAPSVGTIKAVHLPSGNGVRVDTAVYQGYETSEFYDSLIAKLITVGADLEDARLRMLAALGEFRIEGVRTTIPFHRELLAFRGFGDWDLDTDFVERNPIVEQLMDRMRKEREAAVSESAAIAAAIIARGMHRSARLEGEAPRRSASWSASGGPRFYDAV